MADFIKLVESWSFSIDMNGGIFSLPTSRQKENATPTSLWKKAELQGFLKIRPSHFRFETTFIA